MGELESFHNAILADGDMQRVLDRLTLVEEFHAVMLMCDMPRVAKTIVDILRTELAIRREQPIHLVHFDPYRATQDLLAPMTFHSLVDQVLAPLMQGAAAPPQSFVVNVIDASRTMPLDDAGWRILFQRMNERRNAIVRAVNSALVFIVPLRYEAAFARAAPDFWSILGTTTIIKTPNIEDKWQWIQELEPTEMEPWVSDVEPMLVEESIEELQREIQEARGRLAHAKDEARADTQRKLLLSQLARFTKTAIHADLFDIAISAGDETIMLARELPWSNGSATILAIIIFHALVELGRLLGQRKGPGAVHYLDEAITLVGTEFERAYPATLAHAFSTRGHVHTICGQFAAATNDFMHSIQLVDALVASPLANVEPLRKVATSFYLLGKTHLAAGQIDDAIHALTKNITYCRRLTTTQNHVESTTRLAFALSALGDAYRAHRDFEIALASYDEATETCQAVLIQAPQNKNARYLLALILLKISSIHRLRGDVDRSKVVGNSALEAVVPLLGDLSKDLAEIRLAERIRAQLAQLDDP